MILRNNVHCKIGLQCKICRSLADGRSFRIMLMNTCDDVCSVDFDCPHGKAWRTATLSNSGPESWGFIVASIESAPDSGVWQTLKHQLHSTIAMLDLHSTSRGACWARRQRKRITDMYARIKELEQETA
jgi:hypothetical protein